MHPVTRTVERLHRAGVRVGPVAAAGAVSDEAWSLLLAAGLRRDHRVLEVGAGCLRIGHRVIGFLQPGHYCAIEPETEWVEQGRRAFDVDAAKAPRFDANREFDFGVFGTRFDAVLARSIWSHASRGMIRTMLDGFLRHSTSRACLMASYYPAEWRHVRRWPYYGRRWRYPGATRAGAAAHRSQWIAAEAGRRGLVAHHLRLDGMGQRWVVVARPGAPALDRLAPLAQS